MSVITERSAEIRAFQVDIPEEAVDDLRRRIVATRLPEKAPVDDPSQGVQLATIQALVRYWGSEYDARGVSSVPVAVSVFPRELYRAPRSWAEQAYPNLIYFNEVDRGDHFAAWQEPELFTDEVRAGFRSLRS